jgi:dienelactone hydrolase
MTNSMTTTSRITAAFVAVITLLSCSAIARAQEEFPPPQGKGRVVLVSSGVSGVDHYKKISADIAKLGYDAVLVDGSKEEGTHGAEVKADMAKALAMPHAIQGKVALVGFSAGGGEVMYYGTQWPDQVAVVIAWFPANSFIRDVPGFGNRLAVPLVVFAGGKDHYRKECCTADKAQALADAAKSANHMMDLTVYPDAEHDFNEGGTHYNPKASADAFQKTSDALMKYFPPNQN